MDHRRLGSTDLSVSMLGLGGPSLGGVFGPVNERSDVRAVRHALELGSTVFDVSPYYGHTRAEAMLGPVLAPVRGLTWRSGRPENAAEELHRVGE